MNRILFILFALFSTAAHALNFDAGIGQTKFTRSDDGVYWQQGPQGWFAHTLNLKSTSWDLGVSGDVNSWMRWRIGYKYLGAVTTQAQATTDEDYQAGGGGCVPTGCDPDVKFSTFKTQGRAQGIPITIMPYTSWGPFSRVGLEVGAYIYKVDIKIQATRCWDCAYQTTGIYSMSQFNVSPTIGIMAQYKSTQFALSLWDVGIKGDQYEGVSSNWRDGLGRTVNFTMRTEF